MPGTGARTGYKARYIAAIIGAAAPGATSRPQGSLYATASAGYGLMEAHFMSAASGTAKRARLTRMTSQGNVGAAVTPASYDNEASPATMTPFQTHTSGNPSAGEGLHAYTIPLAVGHGQLWGFPEEPVEVGAGTDNGIGFLLNATALGIADVTYVWEE